MTYLIHLSTAFMDTSSINFSMAHSEIGKEHLVMKVSHNNTFFLWKIVALRDTTTDPILPTLQLAIFALS